MDILERVRFEPPELGTVLALSDKIPIGATILDNSPFGNHGTITGATWNRLPSGLWYLNYDGDDRVNCGQASSLKPTNDATWECWTYITSLAVTRTLFSYRNSNLRLAGVAIYVSTAGALVFLCYTNEVAARYYYYTDNAVISTNTLYHVMVKFNKDWSAGDRIRMYVNTSKKTLTVGTENTASLAYPVAPAAASLLVGAQWNTYPSVSENHMVGRIMLPLVAASTTLDAQVRYNQTKHLFGV